MTTEQFLARNQYFDLVHGVTMRAIAAFSDEELGFRPAPGTRTPRELVFHMYTQEQRLAEAARDGTFSLDAANSSTPEDPANAAAVSALATVRDLQAYAAACHAAANNISRAMLQADISRSVDTFLGSYPAWRYFAFAYDEHWHHRGQLYTYLRLCGKKPPNLYDYTDLEIQPSV
jgi:uncharacterized damage-inducible protein DinB